MCAVAWRLKSYKRGGEREDGRAGELELKLDSDGGVISHGKNYYLCALALGFFSLDSVTDTAIATYANTDTDIYADTDGTCSFACEQKISRKFNLRVPRYNTICIYVYIELHYMLSQFKGELQCSLRVWG